MNRILRCLEGWIDPFVSAPAGKLPVTAGAYLWFLVRQSPWPFVAMLLLGGATALVEAGLYSFIGIIVDLLQTTPKDELFTQNWQLFAGMAAVVLVLRTVLAFFTAGVEEQTVVPGFYARVRWQAHQRIMDQSIAFFHDEFAGRISSKVWQAGQAAGEFMVTLLQVVWYIAVYALATLLLLGELNWRLGAAILVWLAVFSVIARYYVPRIRNHSRAAAHAASGATGRLVDTYSNIQTVKLFSSRESEQAGVRAIFESYLAVLKRFTRNLTEVRSLMSLLSSVMMVSIGWFSLVLWQDGILTAGDVAVALGLALRLNLLLGRMLGQLNSLFRSFGTLQDSVDMLTRPIAVTDQPGAPSLMVSAGAIVFDKVSFHYGKRGGVIDDLSFAV
ncbi:MAG: ABC transporter transmembrane domain-containing protein, partial [Pannonibacter indicus]